MAAPLNADAPCQKVMRAMGNLSKIFTFVFRIRNMFFKNIVRRVLPVCLHTATLKVRSWAVEDS